METVEIRQNKKTLIPMITLLTIVLFGMIYYIFFSGKFESNDTIKIVYVFLTVSLAYTIYIPTKKFIKNEPVLTLSKSEIEINEKGKSASYVWKKVIDYTIEKEEDGGTYYLTIETLDDKRKINISWLDKSPNEIEELLKTYRTI